MELPVGRYLMYLRKSRADVERERQGEFETLGKHERELREMCARMRIPIDGEPYRELVSGESVMARAEFLRLMREVQSGGVAGVVVHAVDRLGRGDMMEYGWILSTFQFTRTLIVTPGKVYDPADPYDLQQLQMQMFFANTELSGIKFRLKEGKERAVRDGQHIASQAPLGYRKKVTEAGMKTLEPDEWAPFVAEAFERVAAGERYSPIARDMRMRGVPGKWDVQRVKVMVRNPVYKGYVSYNRRVSRTVGRDGMALIKRTEYGSDPIVVKGLHDGIVDEELWQRANDALKATEPRCRRDAPLVNPLAGVLRCSDCGRVMHAVGCPAAHGKIYYVRHPVQEACDCSPAPLEHVIALVADSLTSIASDIEVHVAAGVDESAALAQRLEALGRERSRIAGRIDRLVGLYIDGGMDAGEYAARRAALDADAAEVDESIARCEASELRRPLETAARLKDLTAMIKDSSISAQARNDALKAVVAGISYENRSHVKGHPEVRLEITLL